MAVIFSYSIGGSKPAGPIERFAENIIEKSR